MPLTQLDFAPATNILSDLLFKVDKVPLATHGDADLFAAQLSGVPIKEYKAVMNIATRDVLSVVTNNYRLITNEQALALGKQAFVKLFPSVKEQDLIPFKVIASKRKTFCHIDLIHKEVNLKAWEQDTWLPFLRVTNSYNRQFALSFELGFVRELCSNGVIFDKKTVKVKYPHTKNAIPPQIEVDVTALRNLEREFASHLLNLKRFYVKADYFFPLLCKACDLKMPEKEKSNFDKQMQLMLDLKDKTKELAAEYICMEGENAFAAFNVMTDIISHQNNYKNLPGYLLQPNSFYHKISGWMREYTEAAEVRSFEIEKYLDQHMVFNSLGS